MTVDGASWDDLRVLLAVARTGSLSQAARQLGATQPTIGRRLDRLEAHIGVPLVRRTSQGCALSERGAALVPLIERMQEAAHGVRRLASSAHNDLEGRVRIATGPLPARFLARRLPQLMAGAPGLRLEVLSSTTFVQLERGDADLALRNAPPAGDDWVVRRLRSVRYGVYAAPSFVDAHPDVLVAADRSSYPWIGFERGIDVASARWLADRIGREPDLAFSSSLLILEAAACGAGLALLPLYCGDDDPRLRRVGPLAEGLGFESLLVVHPNALRIPRVRWVVGRLRGLLGSDQIPAAE